LLGDVPIGKRLVLLVEPWELRAMFGSPRLGIPGDELLLQLLQVSTCPDQLPFRPDHFESNLQVLWDLFPLKVLSLDRLFRHSGKPIGECGPEGSLAPACLAPLLDQLLCHMGSWHQLAPQPLRKRLD
jgi:hypothetical protein